MRLFIAIELPAPLRESLGRLQAGLRRELGGLRWVRPEGIHLTLKFLGEVPDAAAVRLRAALVRGVPAAAAPFELRVAGLGVFPEAGRPRVLWIGLQETARAAAGALATLQSRVEEAAAAAGFAPERRRFFPHLTLARAGRVAPPGWDQVVARRREEEAGTFGVASVSLIQSILRRDGAEYRKIEEFPL